MLFRQAAPEKLVAQAGRYAIGKEIAIINHVRINLLFQPGFVIQAALKRRAAGNLFLWRDSGIITADHVCPCLLGGRTHQLIHGPVNPVITVHEGDILPFGLGKTALSGGCMAAVWLMMTMDEIMFPGIGIADGCGIVCGTVVHQNQFIVSPFLCQDAVDTAGQKCLHIVYGDDDTQKRCG